ncbi:hypothetical protein [Nocardia sp. NPDC052566]|uniref:hypothetical protein n=1 Tax=Nocardia sp. NPDC052566 TaxID=3364330 RepID=UPI0037CADB30
MSDSIILDTDALKKAGDKMVGIQRSIDVVIAKLSSRVTANGTETWGDDKFGEDFANGTNGYTTSRQSLLTGGTEISKTVRSFGHGMIKAGKGFVAIENGNESDLAG